jgi:hypothetical protein
MRLLHLFDELPLLELVHAPISLSCFLERLNRPVLPASTPHLVLSYSPPVCLEFASDTPVLEICVFRCPAYKVLYFISFVFCA